MKRIAAAIMLALLAACLSATEARTEVPTPSPIPTSWDLQIEVRKPQAIQVTLPNEAKPRVFWHLLYTVTNSTGADQFFVPEFVLYTDTGQALRAGQGVPSGVFQTVKQTVNDPLLLDAVNMAGRLLQGADNAKTGVAIWPDFDAQAGGFDVFIGGLSGETVEVKLPSPVEVMQAQPDGSRKAVQKDTAILSKTLELQYAVPGEAAARLRADVVLKKKDWVMR